MIEYANMKMSEVRATSKVFSKHPSEWGDLYNWVSIESKTSDAEFVGKRQGERGGGARVLCSLILIG